MWAKAPFRKIVLDFEASLLYNEASLLERYLFLGGRWVMQQAVNL